MKHKILILIVSLILTILYNNKSEAKTRSENTFSLSDSSLVQYEIPEWYKDAKIGYWVTWGLYSIPAYAGDHAAEWYGRWMYNVDDNSGKESGYGYDKKGLKTAAYHRQKYGDPSKFQYADFIPMFKAEKFNADVWADLFQEGGAKFFVMMAMHHDSFCLWDSKTQPFNSVDMGPNKDFVKLMQKAIKKRGMKFGVSNHSAWNGQFFEYRHRNGFDRNDTKKDIQLYGSGKVDSLAVKRWWKRTTELADKYHPDLYYFDWGWNMNAFTKKDREDFLVYYYNKALDWNKTQFPSPNVVVNYKNRNKLPYGSAVLDLERGGMKGKEESLWQNDTSIGLHSWSFDPDEVYRTPNQCVDMLVDIVSKNGVLLLDIGPKPDGSIPQKAKETIRAIGKWLELNGDAIYSTRPWKIYGEGPTVPKEKMNGDWVEYTAQDIRFTSSKDEKNIYAIFLGWPENNEVLIKSLTKDILDMNTIKSVYLINNDLGKKINIKYKQSDKGLRLQLQQKTKNSKYAYAIKFIKK